MLGGVFDTHYPTTRLEFASCIYDAKSKYETCKSYSRCDARLKAAKGKCDSTYFQASKAKKPRTRADFNTMDKCYT